MNDTPRYFGDSYCCPACGTAFTLIRKEITGCGMDNGASVLRCPACRADNAVRVSDTELALVAGYVKTPRRSTGTYPAAYRGTSVK
ncbi:MAG: hypothetical protein LBL85_00475 [Methanocalculaceae archaeon]|jgi:hypothetical protein|nr:hypothetical protein [Methanocalculaceae archaeon]